MEETVKEKEGTTITEGKKGKAEMGRSYFEIFNVWGVVAGPYLCSWNCYPFFHFR
jgi:hypothetical protein